MSDLQLEVKNLECVRADRTLFSDLSFSLQQGESLQVQGRNGSGKTSLIRILCGLSLPESGAVLWGRTPIQQCRYDYFQELTYIGHKEGIKGELTPIENLKMACTMNGSTPAVSIESALDEMGLADFRYEMCRTLSAGQRRRVALARLLLHNTALWILDEPFTALDREGISQVEKVLMSHVQHGGLLVMTSHHGVHLEGTKTIDLSAKP